MYTSSHIARQRIQKQNDEIAKIIAESDRKAEERDQEYWDRFKEKYPDQYNEIIKRKERERIEQEERQRKEANFATWFVGSFLVLLTLFIIFMCI